VDSQGGGEYVEGRICMHLNTSWRLVGHSTSARQGSMTG
jgi:hypothetical protein